MTFLQKKCKYITVFNSPSNRAMYNESLVKRFIKLGVAWLDHPCSNYNTIIRFKYNNKLYINYGEV